MAVGRRDSATRAVGDTATASQAAGIVTRAVGERGHGNLIKPREGAAAATQPPSPSEVHALGRHTEEEDGARRSSSELKDGGFFPGSKKVVV
jgi:hypothetical protein